MRNKQAAVTETKNEDGSTTMSMKLSEMSLEQLVQVNQALGRQRDSIRDQMLHIRGLIDKKVGNAHVDAINQQIAQLEAQRDGKVLPGDVVEVHGDAPGAVIEAKAAKG